MISSEQRAEIRRLFFAEHWKVGTIAVALGLHHDTIANALETHRFESRRSGGERPSILDAYKPLIVETLEQHPRLRATRLYEMVRARGYTGGRRRRAPLRAWRASRAALGSVSADGHPAW
jgi:IS30 family transposase